ncbi:hypothetical protein SLS59_002467 [Nothophoma quercina]|uniref:DNA endonuclease activator Ctp1 C-terminal domain-containing protein n=1 Tax=Nothophoma quercina TaxID=749835 RepID=A0ABR3RTR5_9PLEO
MTDFATWVEKNRGLWTRVYDEVIVPDFEKEWKKRDENQQLLFNYINEQIVKNARVVEENERLETELQQRAESTAPSTAVEDAAAASTGVPEEQHRELTEQYDELTKKYQDLSQKVKYLERKNSAVMQKNRDMKESVRAWQQYADRQKPNPKLKATARADERLSANLVIPPSDEVPPHMPSSPRSISTVRTPLLRADRGRSSPAPDLPLTEAETGREAVLYGDGAYSLSTSVTSRGPAATSNNEFQGAAYRRLNADVSGAPNSSQTTVDEAGDQANRRIQAGALEDEDDLPQVVAERSLKRKRGQPSKIEVYTGCSSDGTPARPHRVKEEPPSSPPPAMHLLMRTETIDLDEPAPEDSDAAAEMRALSEPMGPPLIIDQHVLQPLDSNVVAHTPERDPNKRLKQAGTRHFEHGILAESGEELPPMDENELRLPPSAARARFNQRLRAAKTPQTPVNRLERTPTSGSPLVKEEQMPSPPMTIVRSEDTPSGSRGLRKSSLNVCTNQQEDIVLDGRPVWSMRASEKRHSAQRSNISPSDRQQRLRYKPIKELKVHDFKPNPAFNQGFSYAFSEAVRKRGDRLCLPGCTNPECCGSTFRRLAEALEPLPAPQEEAFLQEYLGDAYNTVISTQMSSDERAELILQARTKKMAKENGKHREAYERRRTPPGFWRVDFPTTQEQEEDRVRAKEQEVNAVQERWLDAMRGGGRWVFRDE